MLKPNFFSKRARSGITMIELVVVISTVGVLFAIGAPTLQYSREKSRETVCRNNIYQLDIAVERYLLAHGRLPKAAREGKIGGWAVELLPYLDGKDLHKKLQLGGVIDQALMHQIKPVNVLQCPSRPNPSTAFSHYALSRDDGGKCTIFDAPVTTDHLWINGLELPRESMTNSRGPHTGGFLYGGGAQGIHLMLDGKIAD